MRSWYWVQHKFWAWVSDRAFFTFQHAQHEAYTARKRATK